MKKKTGLIIAIVAIVVVLAGAGVAAYILEKDYITNKYMLMTKSEEEYFEWFAQKTIQKTAAELEEKAGERKNFEWADREGHLELLLHVEDEFCDLFNLYTFEDEALYANYSEKDGRTAVELVPMYNNRSLVKLRLLYEQQAEKLYAQLPTYNDSVINFSGAITEAEQYLDPEVRDYLGELKTGLENLSDTKTAELSYSELFVKYAEYFADKAEDISLEEVEEVKVNDEVLSGTEIELEYDADALREMVEELAEMLCEDGILTKELAGEDNIALLTGLIDDDANIRIRLYVDNRAKLLAQTVQVNIKSTKVGAQITTERDEEETTVSIGLSINDIKAANIVVLSEKTDSSAKYSVSIKPTALVKSFIGDYSGLSAVIDVLKEKASGSIKLTLLNNNNEIAKVSAVYSSKDYSTDLLELTNAKVYDYDTVLESDYFDATALVGLALKIIDKIDEQFVNNYINSQLYNLLGDGFTIDTIREYHEQGFFDMFSGTEDTGYIYGTKDNGAGSQTSSDTTLDAAENSENGGNEASENSTTDGTENSLVTDGQDLAGSSEEASEGETEDNPIAEGIDTMGENPAFTPEETGNENRDNAQTEEVTPGENGTQTENAVPTENGTTGSVAWRVSGVNSPEPSEYQATTWEYPKADVTYDYSHLYLANYITLGKYKGLTAEVTVAEEVTPEAFEVKKQEYLASYKESFTVDPSGITIEMGDDVYFDIVPIVGGRPFTMYNFTDCYELVGSEMYGEGLDEKIIGLKVGDVIDVTTTLGEQFGDFSGYNGTFRVTITKIDRFIEPAWTEEFVCGCLGFASLDDCSDYIMAQLGAGNGSSEEDIKKELLATAIGNSKLKTIPENIYNNLRQEVYDSYYDVTVAYGQRPEEYFGSIGYDAEALTKMIDSDINDNLFSQCFYAAIAKAEGISLTGAEVIALVNAYMDYYGVSDFNELMNYLTLDTIVDYEIASRVSDLIYDAAKLTYKNK